MLGKIIKALNRPQVVLLHIINKINFKIIPDAIFLKLKYKLMTEKKLDLDAPKTFNEKLQWLKLHDRKPEYTLMVDKYEVRRYIANTIGEEYLIPLLGVYNSFEEIDFDLVPNQFVLKPNHTSGNIFICKDKSKIDFAGLKREVSKWLRLRYYWVHREWPYKNIKPRIICEQYMVEESGVELKDYKLMCFNGEVKCVFVCLNRYSRKGMNIDVYDANWQLMPFGRKYHSNSGRRIGKPKNFAKMIEFAERLSKNIPFLRVDFYEVKGQLYFGELTFYPGSGYEEFSPESYDHLLGSWLELPEKTAR